MNAGKIDEAFFEAQASAADIPLAQRAQRIAKAFNSSMKGKEEYLRFRMVREAVIMQVHENVTDSLESSKMMIDFFNKVVRGDRLPSPESFKELSDSYQQLKSAHAQRTEKNRESAAKAGALADVFKVLAAAEPAMRDMPPLIAPARHTAEIAAHSISQLQVEKTFLAIGQEAFNSIDGIMRGLQEYIDKREKLIEHLAKGLTTTVPVTAPATARFTNKKR